METRRLLARIAASLSADADEAMELGEGPEDQVRRRKDKSYFNPSPEEIHAATQLIQTEWTEHEWAVRAVGPARSRRWRVPQVRIVAFTELEG